MTEDPPRRPRGNPNFQKRKEERLANQKQENSKQMADKETTEEAAPKEPKDATSDIKKAQEAASAQAPAPAASTATELPADLFSDDIPGASGIALDGPVKQKSYTALPTDAGTAPNTDQPGDTGTGGGNPPPVDGQGATTAPGAAPAPPKTPEEIQSQAGQTVDLMIKGYEKLHALGRWFAKIDEADLAQLHAKGKINLHQTLPIKGQDVSVGQFFQDMNTGIDETIVVSDEFKTNIRPPLTRLCIKHNLLLSDELYVGSIVLDDIVTKTGLLIGLKKSANLVLEACQAMVKAQQEANANRKKRQDPPPAEDGQEPPQEPEPPMDNWQEPEEV